MAYKSPGDALTDTIRLWEAIARFTDDDFKCLESKCAFNHILIEIVKREAMLQLRMDEGIINYCPLCDFYNCSQRCLLSEPSFSESCNFGCTKRWSCMEFQEHILEGDWDKARDSAQKFARELEGMLPH
ncbi:MAG: hypothetical protein ACMUIS_07720 [bacterium]